MLRNFSLTIAGFAWAAILVLVGARFLALLVDANRGSEIVDRLYRHSDFWVKPFFGMFDLSNKTVETGGVFEPASLIAFAVYVLAGELFVLMLQASPFAGFSRGGSRGGHRHHGQYTS